MFKRSLKNIDTWSLELKACAILESDPLHIDISRINRKNNPVLFNIATAYLKFQHKFWLSKGNIHYCKVLGNKFIKDKLQQYDFKGNVYKYHVEQIWRQDFELGTM